VEIVMGMKGHPQSNCGAGGGGSGGVWMKKKKIAMVVVVILVGVMGVMVVQKVRDRRLFNLVIKDKDRQILTLNLLLQVTYFHDQLHLSLVIKLNVFCFMNYACHLVF
jgi:hypothetical protein